MDSVLRPNVKKVMIAMGIGEASPEMDAVTKLLQPEELSRLFTDPVAVIMELKDVVELVAGYWVWQVMFQSNGELEKIPNETIRGDVDAAFKKVTKEQVVDIVTAGG